MSFIPGKVIKEFTTKQGRPAVIRYPQWSDLDALTVGINSISAEDTFIRFGGEQQSRETEAKYLGSLFAEIEMGKNVSLMCFVAGEYAGMCNIRQDDSLAARRLHVGIFGIALTAAFRDAGVGTILAQTTIDEAKRQLRWLKLLSLDCFASNERAIHVYEKLGFKHCGALPGALKHGETFVDEVYMFLPVDA